MSGGGRSKFLGSRVVEARGCGSGLQRISNEVGSGEGEGESFPTPPASPSQPSPPFCMGGGSPGLSPGGSTLITVSGVMGEGAESRSSGCGNEEGEVGLVGFGFGQPGYLDKPVEEMEAQLNRAPVMLLAIAMKSYEHDTQAQ